MLRSCCYSINSNIPTSGKKSFPGYVPSNKISLGEAILQYSDLCTWTRKLKVGSSLITDHELRTKHSYMWHEPLKRCHVHCGTINSYTEFIFCLFKPKLNFKIESPLTYIMLGQVLRGLIFNNYLCLTLLFSFSGKKELK